MAQLSDLHYIASVCPLSETVITIGQWPLVGKISGKVC